MNVYDSGRMADVVAPLGYKPVDEMAEADLVIFNTCHIREKATEKLFSELGRLHEIQLEREKKGERIIVAVAGCVAQAEGPEIKRRAPYVDMIFGPQTYHQLPQMIAQITRGAGQVLNTEFPSEPKFDQLPKNENQTGVSAFLAIQEGCDKFCSYCVVPYTRGAEYSRSVSDVENEARQLVKQGVKEITLLGQTVNSYHGEGGDGKSHRLSYLINRIAEIDGLLRIRYMTSYPNDMDDDLIAAHRDAPKLMPFLHLPLQSGADSVLKAMNRKHTAKEYLTVIEKLRAARPDIALSSDFIIGFPGERDMDFKATVDIVREVGFAQSYSFKYSRRPGTPAATMPRQVPEDIKDARLAELQALLRDQLHEFNDACVGKILPVLFEDAGRKDEQVKGRSPYMQSVHVAGSPELIGKETLVKITTSKTFSLTGEIVT